MRTHIYQQEISGEVEIIVKEAEGHTYYGVAFILKSADSLHDTPDDDDRSKVVFWTSDSAGGISPVQLGELFRRAAWQLRRLPVIGAPVIERSFDSFDFRPPQ